MRYNQICYKFYKFLNIIYTNFLIKMFTMDTIVNIFLSIKSYLFCTQYTCFQHISNNLYLYIFWQIYHQYQNPIHSLFIFNIILKCHTEKSPLPSKFRSPTRKRAVEATPQKYSDQCAPSNHIPNQKF